MAETDPKDDLVIQRDDLDDVVAIAAKLQHTARDQGDESFEGDEIDIISDTTGLSREQLAEAQQLLVKQRRARRDMAMGVAGVALLLGVLAAGLSWEKLFPPDPQIAVAEAKALVKASSEARTGKRLDEAVTLAERATKLDPKSAEAWNIYGMALQAVDRHADARGAYEKAVAHGEGSSKAAIYHYNLGTALGKTPETHALAMKSYERAIALDPKYGLAYNNIGWLHGQAGRNELARDYHRKALAVDPSNDTAFSNLRIVLGKLAPKGGPEALERRVEATQARTRIYNLLQAKKHAEVVAQGEAAAKRYPDAVLIWNDMGLAYEAMQRPVEAARVYRRGVEADEVAPDAAYPYYNLGRLAANSGDHDTAVGYYRRALLCKPTYAPANVMLGKSYEQLGRKYAAMAAFRAALKDDPRSSEAQAALARLEKR